MTEEAQRLAQTIREMEASLGNSKRASKDADDLEVTYPLTRCLKTLKEKYNQVSKIHRERFEQVRSMCYLPRQSWDGTLTECRTGRSPRFVRVPPGVFLR